MKQCKTLLSIVMAIMMLLTMMIPTLAAQEGKQTGGSITINNAVVGQTYNAYQILYLESYDAATGTYAYKANSAWVDWLKTQTTYVKVDDDNYVTWVETLTCTRNEHTHDDTCTEPCTIEEHTHTKEACYTQADVAAFAKLAQEKAKTLTTDASIAATAPEGTPDAKTVSITFSSLKLGYYLIDTTLGSLCSLTTTKPAATVQEKNEIPVIDKKIVEGSNKVTTNDAKLGDVVNYETVITVKKGTENYKLHDKMSDGLTLDKTTIKVQVNNADVDAEYYTITTENLTDGCDFEIAFENSYIATLALETQIVVTYNATVNTNAVIAGNGNTNETKLTFGAESDTEWVKTTTYVWEMEVFKYTGTDTPLAGAAFTLSTNADGSDPIAFVDKGNNVYRVAVTDDTNKITEITTDATGKFEIEGLDSGTYYLTETKAPNGYNKLSESIKVVINGVNDTNPGKLSYTYKDQTVSNVSQVKVLNQSGTELPSTGGIGTTIFYCVGATLALGAFVLLVTKKRMGRE